MPIDYKAYPPGWKTKIRPRIIERAGNRCEWCGAENKKPHPETGSIVVLTVAHLDHDPENWFVSDERLAALCQRCHLGYDAGRIKPPVKKPDGYAYVLIHHVGGEGRSEVCGVYTDRNAAMSCCIDDSWGVFSIELNVAPLPPDKVVPTEYVYPTRKHKRWLYTSDGWSRIDE